MYGTIGGLARAARHMPRQRRFSDCRVDPVPEADENAAGSVFSAGGEHIVKAALAFVALLCLTVPLVAQAPPSIEVSPFAGYLFGGTIFHEHPSSQNVGLANDLTYGVRVGWNATPGIEPEFQWSQAKTHLSVPGSVEGPPVNVNYFLGGASYNFGASSTRPYVSLDFGAVRLAAIDFVPSTLFTLSLGAGVKHFFTPHFGLRVDARGYASATDHRLKSICLTQFGDSLVGEPCAHDWILNGDVTGGVVVAF